MPPSSYRLNVMSFIALAVVIIGYPAMRMALGYIDIFPSEGARLIGGRFGRWS